MIRLLMVVALVTAGCGDAEKKSAKTDPVAVNFEVEKLNLAADPGQALSITEAKAAAPKDEVVVVGRIDNLVKGFATFNLVDASLDFCNSGADPMEACPTPWDYCCTNPDVKSKGTLTVEVRDANDKVLKTALPKLRLLDLVAVKGKLLKDEHGNVIVRATGWFRRDRPELGDDLRWPE